MKTLIEEDPAMEQHIISPPQNLTPPNQQKYKTEQTVDVDSLRKDFNRDMAKFNEVIAKRATKNTEEKLTL